MKYLVWLILVASLALNVWQWNNTSTKADEVVRTETISIEKPTPFEITKLVPVTRRLKVVRTDTIERTDTLFRCDTLRTDSVDVEIPITQKHYRDERYDLWISGYEPQVDSMKIYSKTKIITRNKRWGVGLQLGVGYNGKVTPYIGVGISYNVFCF